MKKTNLFALAVSALVCAASAHAITIDMVPVDNPGNAPDTRYDATGFGSVSKAYQIGKYEVTAGEYTAFLNAVAKADPNGLYNTSMGDPNSAGANIQRSGTSPNFSYGVAADWANRPVNYVTFWDAARFVNWLHNGQPTGPQGAGTTETGAYHDVGNQQLFGRNAGAKFFIPTENEWYKAAYHNQSAGLAASYFDYPTGSNSAPLNTLPDPGNHANFDNRDANGNSNYTIGPPYFRTAVGAFVNSASPYGTFDQGGNLWEWTETVFLSTSRILRGGSYYDISDNERASHREDSLPFLEFFNTGFRVAAVVPEPTTLTLYLIGFPILMPRRNRRH
jgi:formylglycine-generating enzyme required for sulfatase activity